MTTSQTDPTPVQAALPRVGDLVTHGDDEARYVVSNIVGEGTEGALWEMRNYTGPNLMQTVGREEIDQWPVKARRGTFQPWY